MFEVADMAALVTALAGAAEEAGPAERVDRIAGWERVAGWVHARQVQEVAALAQERIREDAAAGAWTSEQGRHVAEEVALARRVSPMAGAQQVAFARGLVEDHPATLAAMLAGWVGAMAARTIVAECGVPPPELRRQVDPAAAVEAPELTPGQVRKAVTRRVIAADPAAAERRAAAARADKTVALLLGRTPLPPCGRGCPPRRPWPAGTPWTHTPGACGPGVTRARSLTCAATPWSSGSPAARPPQVRRSTSGWSSPRPLSSGGTPPRPPCMVTRTACRAAGLRRLITDPVDGRVLTIDTRRRRFDGRLRTLILARDQVCRAAGCTAPIRDIDHLIDHARGGPTSAANGHGLCQRSHNTRHHLGWRVQANSDRSVTWITPTGHRYSSRPPPAFGHGSQTLEQLVPT